MAEIHWEFTDTEIDAIKNVVGDREDNPFVQSRWNHNVEPADIGINESEFWDAHLAALLTSRQRSGPESQVAQFLRHDIETLSLEQCRAATDVQSFISSTLEDFGGILYYNNIGQYIEKNLEKLDTQGGWTELWEELDNLLDAKQRDPKPSDSSIERRMSIFLHTGLADDGLHGIGPKQSRNLLQVLGISRYETPVDSRITRWLNEQLDLPYHVSGEGLSQPEYYHFVMDILQDGCSKANVLPCMFDAAVFSSYDTEWSEEAANATF